MKTRVADGVKMAIHVSYRDGFASKTSLSNLAWRYLSGSGNARKRHRTSTIRTLG
jgi:hypothetical protein